jgi:hypothetical protein
LGFLMGAFYLSFFGFSFSSGFFFSFFLGQ